MIRHEALLDQADALIAGVAAGGTPSGEDLRRAVSAAYYALFHQCLAAAADEVAGVASRTSDLYVLAYRSVDHRRLRDLCVEYRKPSPAQRYRDHLSAGLRDRDLAAYAAAILDLYELRASADYDPTWRIAVRDARGIVATARAAAARFAAADPEKRRRFLILLHFPPR